MDSWKYLCEGKGGLLSEELDFSMDGGRCKSKSLGCEFKPLFNIENFPLVSNTQALERLDLVDLGFYDEIRKSYSVSSEPSGEVFSDEIGADSYGNVVSPFCEERDLGSSQISTDFGHSNKQDCTLFDLKLGSKESGVLKAQDSGLCVPAKRPRLMALNPRPPCCQVLGCNKDLSSCKSYYKRHKVCDAHTKTSKVIVDGIEQRFCQQCSRFHLLNEFDDGKRSCRRRLAAHNKRRRKPQLTSESGRGIIGFSSPFAFPGGGEGPNVLSGQGGSNMNGILQRSRALSLLSAQSSSSGFHAPQMLSMKADVADPKSTVMNPRGGVMIDLKGPMSSAISCGPQPQPRPQSQPVLEKTNNCQGSSILDLLQLSSHLQRIEQQRHSTECDGG